MSYDAYPNCADVVSREFVIQQAPKSWMKLQDVLGEAEQSIATFAVYIDTSDDNLFSDDEMETLDGIWEKLQKEFKNNTDMVLGIGWFDDEEPSRGNDLEGGVYFHVSDYKVLKPKAEQFRSEIEHKLWVTFG